MDSILAVPRHDGIAAELLATLAPVYLADVAARCKAITAANYTFQLQPFLEWWGATAPHHSFVLSPDLLTEFPAWLNTVHAYKPSTVHTFVSRAQMFLRWLHTSGRLARDISRWLPLPALPAAKPHCLTAEEIGRLLLAAAEARGAYRIRNACLVAFLAETGCRRIEASNAQWQNVTYTDQGRGYCWLETVKGYLGVDKRRTVVFGTTTGKLLRLWSFVSGRPPDRPGPIFDITNSGVRQVIAHLGAQAGVEVQPHTLRRSFATHWIKHCAPPNRDLAERLLEVQLGHGPRSVTQRHYMVLTYEDVAAYYVSPLDGMRIRGLTDLDESLK